MKSIIEQDAMELVMFHCKTVLAIDDTELALDYAKKRNFIDEHNQVTIVGKNVALYAYQNFMGSKSENFDTVKHVGQKTYRSFEVDPSLSSLQPTE